MLWIQGMTEEELWSILEAASLEGRHRQRDGVGTTELRKRKCGRRIDIRNQATSMWTNDARWGRGRGEGGGWGAGVGSSKNPETRRWT